MAHNSISRQAALESDEGGKMVPWGFPLGRLFKREYISKTQYAAGNAFAEVMRTYMLTKGIGAATARAFDPDRHGASLTDRPVKGEGEAQEYMDALKEVDRMNPSGRSATSLLWEVCLREESESMSPKHLGIFREGLNAIARALERRERLAKKRAA